MILEDAHAKLNEIAAYTDNWDSYGAPAFSQAAIETGRKLITRCFELECPPDRVSCCDGIMVLFQSPVHIGNLEAYEDGVIHAMTADRQAPTSIVVWEVENLDDAIRKVYNHCR